MAENKKSVLLYCDIIHTVKELSDEEAGVLFKHYLAYINDQNPTPKDKLTQIVFEPIKQNLKRDLEKWKDKSIKNKEIAIAGWDKRKNANACESIKDDANDADKVKDKVKDKVIDKDIIEDFDFKIPSLEYCIELFKTKTAFNWTEDYAVKSANTFYYFYESKNWMVGKNKMKSLNAAIGGWISRDTKPELSKTKSMEQIIEEKKAYFKTQGFQI
jgi:hypothetical protein